MGVLRYLATIKPQRPTGCRAALLDVASKSEVAARCKEIPRIKMKPGSAFFGVVLRDREADPDDR
jgi:hypothetical protein